MKEQPNEGQGKPIAYSLLGSSLIMPQLYGTAWVSLVTLQDFLDKCPMLIKVDQNSGIDPNVNQCWSINAMILMDIDRHWSALGIDRGSPDFVER